MQLAMGAARQTAARSVATLVALLAVVLASSFSGMTASAWAATAKPRLATAQTADAPAPRKAVIVLGPMGSDHAKYLAKVNAMAAAATAHGMNVVKVFAPHATWKAVVAAANGADLFIYLGHGNGWPSPYPPFQEDSKDGMGLDPSDGSSVYDVKYYGANKIIASIHFAANAIVLINHSCYNAGNGEFGMLIPTQDIAVQRVDNFASGFLAAGARTVFALRIQPGENLIDSLYTKHETMDGFFESTFGSNRDGSYKAYYGWIGEKPNLYFDSVRTPGARIHLDPDHAIAGNTTGPLDTLGYERAVTGDLSMTTDEWLGGSSSGGDNTPPVVTQLSAGQSSDTIPASDSAAPVFTPNGDGISDTLNIKHTLSEGAYLDVSIAKQDGSVVRHFSDWSDPGATKSVWDGKNGNGDVVPDGKYDITVVPTDRAGNVGDPATTSVKVLTAMKSPKLGPSLFYPTDGDALAQVSKQSLTLTEPASLRWRILDANGDVVRTGIDDQSFDAGPVSWSWDGLDDAGHKAPNGSYTSVVTATTDAGSYSNMLSLKLMPFVLKGSLSVQAGQKVSLTLLAAEPMTSWPHIDVKQPGVASYRLYDIKYSPTKFTTTWTVKKGATGAIKITVTGTDTGGGVQSQVYTGSLH